MLTQKDYCDYETCVALKELGYDELCEGYYHLTDDEDYNQLSFEWCCGRDFQNSLNRWRVGAPMLYEAQKWLREEKEFYVFVGREWENAYYYWLSKKVEDKTVGITHSFYYSNEEGQFSSYEEALSEGIKESVKIIKKNEDE